MGTAIKNILHGTTNPERSICENHCHAGKPKHIALVEKRALSFFPTYPPESSRKTTHPPYTVPTRSASETRTEKNRRVIYLKSKKEICRIMI